MIGAGWHLQGFGLASLSGARRGYMPPWLKTKQDFHSVNFKGELISKAIFTLVPSHCEIILLNFLNLGWKLGDSSDFAHFLRIGQKWKYVLRFNHLYLPLANFCMHNLISDRGKLTSFVKLSSFYAFLLKNLNCNKLFTESENECFKSRKAKIAE